jgi:hypothetical protein
MKKLKVDLSELAFVMENASWEISHYLDRETGEILMVSDDIRRELESLYEEIGGLETEGSFDLTEMLQQSNLPEWQKQAILEADQVEEGYGTRYIAIPKADSQEGYGDMESFILTVRNQRLQDELWRAIHGRGAFRRFKDVLADHPQERERWFTFKDEQMHQRVLDWLASEEIEPVIESPESS